MHIGGYWGQEWIRMGENLFYHESGWGRAPSTRHCECFMASPAAHSVGKCHIDLIDDIQHPKSLWRWTRSEHGPPNHPSIKFSVGEILATGSGDEKQERVDTKFITCGFVFV